MDWLSRALRSGAPHGGGRRDARRPARGGQPPATALPARQAYTARGSRASARGQVAAIASKGFAAALSARQSSICWAMSRCQPLGLSSAETRLAVSSLSSRAIGRGFFSVWVDAIDPAFVVPQSQIERPLQVVVDPLRMLDHEAVHVDHPQGPVGTGLDRCRTEPGIVGGEELRALFVRGPGRRGTARRWA